MVRRSQVAFCLAVLLAAVIVGTQLPLGEILQQRSEISSQTAELHKLQADGAELSAQVTALGKNSTIEQIAYQRYGLVRPGQEAYMIVPSSSGAGATPGPLASIAVPPGDVMPSDSAVAPTPASTPASPALRTGIVGQVLQRLEFWRWAF